MQKDNLIDFIYVGLPKAGSTWLYKTMIKHPEIYVPFVKETYFFDRFYEKGIDWYLSHFTDSPKNAVKGEICHDYIYSDLAAERIKKTLGNVKIVINLRDPLEWFVSDYQYALRNGTYSKDINSYFYEEVDISRFDYCRHVDRYIEIFGYQDTCVMFFEDLKKSPQVFIDNLAKFLSIQRLKLGEDEMKPVNSAAEPRNRYLALLVKKLAVHLRRHGMNNLIYKVKNSSFILNFLYKQAPEESKVKAMNSMEKKVVSFFRECKLEQIKGLQKRGLADDDLIVRWNAL